MSETNARSVADMGQHKSHDWRNLFTLVMQLCRVPAEFCENLLTRIKQKKKILNLMRALRSNATRRKVLSFLLGNWQIRIACRLANMKLSIRTAFCSAVWSFLWKLKTSHALNFTSTWNERCAKFLCKNYENSTEFAPLFLERGRKKIFSLKFEQYRMLLFFDFPSKDLKEKQEAWKCRHRRDEPLPPALLRCRQFWMRRSFFVGFTSCGENFRGNSSNTWRLGIGAGNEQRQCLGLERLWSSFKGRNPNSLIEVSVKWLAIPFPEPNLNDFVKGW